LAKCFVHFNKKIIKVIISFIHCASWDCRKHLQVP